MLDGYVFLFYGSNKSAERFIRRPVADQYVLVSNCVKGVWSDFYNAYNAVSLTSLYNLPLLMMLLLIQDSTVDAPNKGNFNMVSTYTSYIRTKTQLFFTNLQSGVNQMIGFYSTSAGGDTVQQTVDLNYGTLKSPGTSQVSANDLKSSIFSRFTGASLIKITVRL